jgi:hypothetical protein
LIDPHNENQYPAGQCNERLKAFVYYFACHIAIIS